MKTMFGLLAVGVLVVGCSTTGEQASTVSGDGDALGDGILITGASTGNVDGVGLSGVPQPTVDWVALEFGDRVLFDYDSAALTPDGLTMIRGWVEGMNLFPDVAVRIEGHCDERGTREYNLALGDKRASTVRDYMIARGMDPERIAVVSYGKEKPFIAGHTDESWRENRRGVLTII